MASTPYPLLYRLFHSLQVVVHSLNIYAGSPSEPFILTIHSKRCIVSNICTNCIKVCLEILVELQENRGFDLYRLVAGAECVGVAIRAVPHPGYRKSSDVNTLQLGMRKLNSMVSSVTGIKQVYKQMKMSLVELKNVIEEDVHRNRESNRQFIVSFEKVDCMVLSMK